MSHRHRWVGVTQHPEEGPGFFACACGKVKDEAASTRGRRNRQRGNAKQREWAKRMGMENTGKYGGQDDGMSWDGMFAGQAKSLVTSRFPGWMSREIEALRVAKPDRVPLLGILESPGSGRKGRRLVVLDEKDWIDLHVAVS